MKITREYISTINSEQTETNHHPTGSSLNGRSYAVALFNNQQSRNST